MARGPLQAAQRAGSRHVSHASDGAYPARATWTRTGPRSSAFLGGAPGRPGQPGDPGEGIVLEFEAVRGVQDARHRPPDHGALRLHRPWPSPIRPAAALPCFGSAPPTGRRPFLARAQQQDLAGVRVGRTLLDVEVVAVVPADHEAQVVDRRVGGGARAHGDPGGAAEDPQETPVPGGLAVVRSEPCDVPGGEQFQERGLHPVQVPVVGDNDYGAPAGEADGGHGLSDQPRPAARAEALQRVQHGAGRLPRAQVLQERRPVAVGGPVRGVQPRRDRRPWLPAGEEQRRIQPPAGSELLLQPGHPGRNGDAQGVTDRSGVPRGDAAGQFGDGGRQHGHGRNHLVQRHEGVAGVGLRAPLQHVSRQFLAVELHLDPDAGLRLRVQGGRTL